MQSTSLVLTTLVYMKKYLEFPDLYFVPEKCSGVDPTPLLSIQLREVYYWIQVIAHLFKKCIIYLGLDKRPLYLIPVWWPPYIPTDLILRFLLGTGEVGGYFLEKNVSLLLSPSDATENVWKLFSITFNPFAAGESMRTWAGEVSPCRCVEIVYGPLKIFQMGFSELHV